MPLTVTHAGDESASIINEMLVQMDGFEDNRGIVVLGATNRPGAIDSALIRPGRFDRIIYMPLPDATGRAKILQVGCCLVSSATASA
jgi:cell division protease FtsH